MFRVISIDNIIIKNKTIQLVVGCNKENPITNNTSPNIKKKLAFRIT